MVAEHVLNTRYGTLCVDRLDRSEICYANAGGNQALRGDPGLLSQINIEDHLSPGVLDAPTNFEPGLRSLRPDLASWTRQIYALERMPEPVALPGVQPRRLGPADLDLLQVPAWKPFRWIWVTWGSAASLLESGMIWGIEVAGQLAAAAATFFCGDRFEDLGVATLPMYQNRGLSSACTARLCQDILARGKGVSWSTSANNFASQRVAIKLGFEPVRTDQLYLIDAEAPD
jgi:RimJ/RimL family protein N-acetyltransferase